MRTLLAIACLSILVHAGEFDGATADTRRWAHPRGPASRSCVSAARAPESLGDPRWTMKLHSELNFAPLTWDGIGYVLLGDVLVGVNLDTGKRIAGKKVGDVQAAALGNGAVFLRVGPKLVQWRRARTSFRRQWIVEVGADASAPCIHEGEIYLTAQGKTVRLRPGRDKPAWKEGDGAFGAPALYGEHVYSLEQSGEKAFLVARARLDGREAIRVGVGRGGKTGLVAVNRLNVCVRIGERWILLSRESKNGKLSIRGPWEVPYTQAPLVYSRSTIGFAQKMHTYVRFRKRKGKNEQRVMVNPKTREDLLLGTGAPIALGEHFCTGLWCANLNSNRIIWHLHERSSKPLLKQGVAFHPVPAGDDRLLLVARNKKSIVCIQPEVIGG